LSSSVDLERVNIPLLEKREIKNKLMILITPDRGLAGALVGNINRKALEVIQLSENAYSILSVGRKGFRSLILETKKYLNKFKYLIDQR